MADPFRPLVDNAPDAIVVSRNGVVLYANAAAARLLGHADVSALVGKPMTFLDARSAEVMRRRIEQMATTGERLVPREYPARRADGSEIVAEIASAIIEFEGAPAVLAYARDVTERTRLRAQLAHADRLAALGTMAAGVAHEINNPLAYISLAVAMLQRQASPEVASSVAQVQTGVDRITAIVRDLRAFGRYDDDAAMAVDLAAAIDDAERLIAHELRPRARLFKEYAALPVVVGVRRHVEQVFVNLLLNAALAQGDKTDGRIVLRARVDDKHVVVTVEDDGAGIAPEHLEAVFEPFFTTRGGTGGTGLGLSVSRDLVVRSGGTLVARSTLGKGTTMELTLLRATAVRSSPAPTAAGLGASATQSEPKPWQDPSARILIVDDEPRLVRAIAGMLTNRAEVVTTADPIEALELLLADPGFDVVLCDVMMPRLSGVDLHERVARMKPGREKRIVFMSGGAYTSHARDYLRAVSNPQLTKPFRLEDLELAIATTLHAAKSR